MPSEQLQTIVALLKAQEKPANPSVAEMRAGIEQICDVFPVAADIRTEAVDAGGVPAEWVMAPGASAGRVVLYLHGGGYVVGSIRSHREMASRISRAAEARVLVIDYRLAPEYPHPAAVDDAVAAYRWLMANGTPAARIAVAGDSAGGGLTVATLLALKQGGESLPAAGVCLSPWVDLEGIGDSMTAKADVDPMVEREGLHAMAEMYLGGQDPRTPLAAPLYGDLAGLPPLLIQVGTCETLLDDSTRLAARAKQAGVQVALEPWEGMIHVWQIFAAMLPEGQQAIDRIGAFVRQHIR